MSMIDYLGLETTENISTETCITKRIYPKIYIVETQWFYGFKSNDSII